MANNIKRGVEGNKLWLALKSTGESLEVNAVKLGTTRRVLSYQFKQDKVSEDIKKLVLNKLNIDIVHFVPRGELTKETTLSKQLGQTEEWLIGLQAQMDVVSISVQQLSASASKTAISLVVAQWQEAVNLRKKQLLAEWK